MPKVEAPGHPGHPPPLSDAVVKSAYYLAETSPFFETNAREEGFPVQNRLSFSILDCIFLYHFLKIKLIIPDGRLIEVITIRELSLPKNKSPKGGCGCFIEVVA